ncbi:hypothetical protein [Streptomyces scabiei]|uniref:hypothetical protein n=1 Tax=Streptomyces scabiei TaxID=1930 RepID=UPI0029AF64FF|nr:hypothetical protein [Streptomyces scabiei]MDX3033736.1 hypothetical protein [Streptomyces scabiei]
MASKTIEPISGQSSATKVLADLIDQYPELPSAYIVIHRPAYGSPATLNLQLNTVNCFEQWRTALGFSPMDVELYPSWVAVDGTHMGVPVSLTAHDIWLTTEQAAEPRDREQVSA